MEFRVLGPVEVAAEGRRLTLGSARQRLLLAVLLTARGEIVAADRLIDATWGARPPPSARKSLHSHLSRLRRALSEATADGGDAVVTEAGGYRVVLERHELDADRFASLVERARERLAADPGAALHGLDDALGRWRGPPFGELAEHEALRAETARLEQVRAAAVADRIEARLALGDHTVIGELEATVAADPLAERPHAQLMRALYLDGRQVAALATYRRLQQRLAEEVGVDPSPELQQLHQRILRQDADLAPTARATPARVTAGAEDPGHRPPTEIATGPIGRDHDIARVAALLDASRVVTLTGPGGVGKSTLAQAVVTRAGTRFDDGVVWCGLAGLRDPAAVPAALVAALGVQQQDELPPLRRLLTALSGRRALVVLDNAEHLLAATTEVVRRIRANCPQVVVLVTSREHLRLPEERVWEVVPLPVPRSGAGADEVAGSPAGRLLCDRARAVEASFALTDANAASIAAVCRRLDGIPLALELAGARLRALSPEALAARLDRRFELLTGGSHDEGGRHHTLQAVVEWSYTMLTDAEARLFERLSTFAGAFPLEAAEEVGAGPPLEAHEVAGVLAELVDKSMVVVERRGGRLRYRLLDTLRAYGVRRLEETGQLDRRRAVHADVHVARSEELATRLRGPDERDAIDELDAVVDDLRVAQAWALATGGTDAALRLPSALHDELVFRPRQEVFEWAEQALALPDAPAQPAYAAALATAARGQMNRGQLDRARELAEAAQTRAEPESLAALWALYVRTTLALYEGRLREVGVLADHRWKVADALGQDYHRALAGVSRVLGLRYRGDDDAAVAAAVEARRDADASGNHTARAWALYSSGEALSDSDPEEAIELLQQAVEAAHRVDRGFIEGVALVSLASLCGRSGRTERALQLFEDAILLWRRLDVYTQQLTTLRNLVELLAHTGAQTQAAVLHGAVASGSTPSFGAEADRLGEAWARIEAGLGAQAARAAAERGRGLGHDELVGHALAALEDA